jgi:hypothetical protein
MLTLRRSAFIAMAVVAASASSALAGTKYATNLVSNALVDPPPNPTLSSKSQIKLGDTGAVSVSLAGVTDAGGALVTTTQAYNASVKAPPLTLDGSEYIVIIKLHIPAVGLVPVIEVPVPVDLTGGKGKTKLNLAGVLGLLGSGLGRGLEITGAEVWGPLGPPAPTCLVIVGNSPHASLLGGDPSCRGGLQIGIAGLSLP